MPTDAGDASRAPSAVWAVAALRAVLATSGLLASLGAAGCRAPEGPERIVLVVVDTLRRDALGCYGGDAETPVFDRLAREGQRFANAVASFHQTTMSMAALFTGRVPSLESGELAAPLGWHGMTWCGLARFDPEMAREQCVPPGIETLADRLGAAGYATIGVVSNPLLFDPYGLSRGFLDWNEVGEVASEGRLQQIVAALSTRTAERVNERVAEALARRRDDRFFLYVHYMDVHDYRVRKAAEGPGPMDARGRYRRAVADADRGVGALLAMLAERGLLEGSVVVFTSDHGERLGERHVVPGRRFHAGNPSFAEVLDVPLIVWPARFAREDALVRGTDVFATLLDLADAKGAVTSALAPGETFTSELRWLTYRRGKFKSYTRRADRGLWLVDLEADPDERHNVARRNPEIAQHHWDRVTALAAALASPRAAPGRAPARDAALLRALGYLAPAAPSAPAEPGVAAVPGTRTARAEGAPGTFAAKALQGPARWEPALDPGPWRPSRDER